MISVTSIPSLNQSIQINENYTLTGTTTIDRGYPLYSKSETQESIQVKCKGFTVGEFSRESVEYSLKNEKEAVLTSGNGFKMKVIGKIN